MRRLPVVGPDGKLAGILSLDDLAREAGRTLRGAFNQHLRERLADIVSAAHSGVCATDYWLARYAVNYIAIEVTVINT